MMKPLPSDLAQRAVSLSLSVARGFLDPDMRGPSFTDETPSELACAQIPVHFKPSELSAYGDSLREAVSVAGSLLWREIRAGDERNSAYTIGALEIYDEPLSKGHLSKGEGGTVWRSLEEVLWYFLTVGGQVMIYDRTVDAGIYVVDLGEEDFDEVVEREGRFAGLIRPLPIVRRLR